VRYLPDRIVFVAARRATVRHISDDPSYYDFALCGNIYHGKPTSSKELPVCKTCEKVLMGTLDKLITMAEDAGFEVHTRRGGTKA
jgi:hypothetical protein